MVTNVGSVAYPLIAVLGDIGVGKTLYGVYVITKFYNQYGLSRLIFSNILLFDIPYVDISFDDFQNEDFMTIPYKLIKNIKDDNGDLFYKDVDKVERRYRQEVIKDTVFLEDGLLVIDEVQEGSGAYNFLNQDVKRLNHFISQIRKYDLELFIITQRLNFISKHLRQILTYHYEINYRVYPVEENGKIFNQVTTGYVEINKFRLTTEGRKLFRKDVRDLRPYFNYYSTKQKLKKRGNKEDETE